jgi:hypothetical protein
MSSLRGSSSLIRRSIANHDFEVMFWKAVHPNRLAGRSHGTDGSPALQFAGSIGFRAFNQCELAVMIHDTCQRLGCYKQSC